MNYKITKAHVKKASIRLLIVLLGCALLAFGCAIFLNKLTIVSGGLSGVGMIVQKQVEINHPDAQVMDIVVAVLTWVFWLLGLLTISKKFALKTLVASIAYPLFLSLFIRVPFFDKLATAIAAGNDTGTKLLCGLFGGAFIGAGVALTFLGGGSTGGVDVLTILMENKLHIKESIGSFIVDGTIVLTAMFVTKEYVSCLCGIISAFTAALSIEFIYVKFLTSYQVDIISDKWEEISAFVQDELGRGATIIPAKGGYKGDERIILRVVFDKSQYRRIRKYVGRIDPKAFITFTETSAVYGEGFKKHGKK